MDSVAASVTAPAARKRLIESHPFPRGSCWLAGDRSPGFRALLSRLPRGRWLPVASCDSRYPVTVAGPRRLLTGLPLTTGRYERMDPKERGGLSAAPLGTSDAEESLLLLLAAASLGVRQLLAVLVDDGLGHVPPLPRALGGEVVDPLALLPANDFLADRRVEALDHRAGHRRDLHGQHVPANDTVEDRLRGHARNVDVQVDRGVAARGGPVERRDHPVQGLTLGRRVDVPSRSHDRARARGPRAGGGLARKRSQVAVRQVAGRELDVPRERDHGLDRGRIRRTFYGVPSPRRTRQEARVGVSAPEEHGRRASHLLVLLRGRYVGGGVDRGDRCGGNAREGEHPDQTRDRPDQIFSDSHTTPFPVLGHGATLRKGAAGPYIAVSR